MGTYFSSAVAIGDLKNAALYFDRLVPVFAAIEFVREREWLPFKQKILPDLLPDGLLYRQSFIEALAEVNQRSFNLMKKFLIRDHSFEPRIQGLSQEEYDSVENDAAVAYFSFVQEFGLSDWPLATEDGPSMQAGLPENESEKPLALLTLSRLRVVDASELSWEQISEIRRDPIARNRLRRLRLFAFENYSGKSHEFVEDDLLCRVADYEASAKQCGLETVQGSLSLVLNSKLAAGALAGSLVSSLFGQPLPALIAGTTGVALEVAGFTLELCKRRLAIESLARDNPVSYISYLRKHL